MLNLDDLTDEERTTILAVLKKEDIVRKTEDRKISNLKTEIQGLRMKSVLRDGDDLSKICARCHTPFGVFFNRGDVCVKCRFRVCKMCQENLLNGKWLCILCYKQRQLKWFLGDWSMETPSRWPSGADLVKASLKLTPISINTNIDDDQVEPSHIKQHSGSESDSQGREAVEFPNQNDQRKLAHLFGTLQNQQKSDKKDKNLIIRRKVGSKKYSDSESDTGSSDSEEYRIQQNRIPPSKQNASSYPAKKTNDSIQQYKDMTSKSRARKELPSSDVQGRKTNIHYQSDNQKGGLHEREKINRNNIDTSTSRAKSESEVTLESYSKESSNNKNKPDLENFVDSVPSSPVKDNSSDKCDLDISDVSSHDKMSYQLNSQKKFRQSATEVVMAMKLSPQNSLSTQKSEISEYSQPSVPRQLRSYDERSNSPFSFDSLPSSHANSPLPRRHFLTESVSGKDSSDTECVSSVSGGDDSGTESHVTSHSGTEDYVEEELSKVRFRRMSVKTIQSSYPNASENSEQDRKLSPRASSEGSLEDSGHVSGASTQENTPIHKRTDSLQSQLSMPSTLSTVTDQSSEETDIDDLVAYHRPLSRTGNLLTTIADSKESILSFYSNAGEVDYGKIPITGEIEFSLEYNYRTGTLEIRIKRCKDLAPAEPKKNRSDPYVKTYLLPDKTRSGKRKTRIKKNTLNPVFEETLRYLISKSELENRTLWVTVWHSDKFGRNDFLGEVTINFSYFRFGDSAAKWYILQEKMDANPPTAMTYRGDIFLSIRFVPPEKMKMEEQSMSPKKKSRKKNEGRTKGQLQVTIKEARNLMAVKSGSYSDPFIKGYLLPDKTKNVKQKTVVVKHSCNPTFNHTFIFDDVSHEELRERCLELTVWDHDKLSSNEFLGGVRLNLGMGRSYSKNVEWMDARGEEISLWQAMIDRPYIWIDGAIILRPNMDKRKA